ncbi:MAG: hypothetical protein KF684_08245 [Phycisphaeraceae bacterium]|nr:hypothetical protein [Phycisphaeraceae bacterium]
MTLGPDIPNPAGRIEPASQNASQVRQAAELQEQRRRRIQPADQQRDARLSTEQRSSDGPLSLAGPSSADVIRRVADYARKLPPPEDLLSINAAANTFALINLDAAKAIAREVRASLESRAGRGAGSVQQSLLNDDGNRGEIADVLFG